MAIHKNLLDAFIDCDLFAPDDVIDNPGEDWVERLRQGNKVWLVKERMYAYIEWAWEPHGTWGRIGLQIDGSQNTWSMCSNGLGSDNKELLLPIKGNLERNPTPLELTELRQLRREVNILRKKVDYLYIMK